MPIRVALAGKDSGVLERLAHSCSVESDFRVVAQVTSGNAAVKAVQTHNPDILVLDLRIKATDASTTLAQLRRLGAGIRTRVVALTDTKSDGLQALLLGAHGVASIQGGVPSVAQCIRDAHIGGETVDPDFAMDALHQLLHHKAAVKEARKTLSEREVEAGHLSAEGLINREIAEQLAISTETAKVHLHHAYQKLKLNGRASLKTHLQDKGLVLHENVAVARASKPLTKRQLEIARLSAEGLSTTAIGKRLGITQGAASSQLQRAFRKLKLRRKTPAALKSYLRDKGMD